LPVSPSAALGVTVLFSYSAITSMPSRIAALRRTWKNSDNRLPIEGLRAKDILDTFDQKRGMIGRTKATDIMAPREHPPAQSRTSQL